MVNSIIELPSLYSHQDDMLFAIREAMRDYRRSILCAPPGTGKTRLAKNILARFANRPQLETESGKALFAVHRRGLVDNASNSFSEFPNLPHGLIMSKRKMNLPESVQVASIDTLNAWFCKGAEYLGDTYDLVIFDEAHAHLSKLRTFLKCQDAKRKAHNLIPTFVIGLTATPQHKELHHVFNKIVKGPSPGWLIENGYLSPFRYFRCTQGKSELLVKSGDDYTENSAAVAMDGLAGDMLKDWMRLARDRATVGFFPRKAHAMEAKEMFCAAGVRAVYLDGDTPDEERKDMFEDLNEGRIDYITNVGVIERGTDIPRIGCVQMCVFVGSIVRWLQMIGRGSRVHPDVEDCIVLDHGNCVQKGWFFEDDVHWSLEWGERPAKTHEPPPTIQCPACGLSYRGGKCKCGYEPTKKERKSQGLEFIGGELQEVKRKEKTSTKKQKTPEQIMIAAMYKAAFLGRSVSSACAMARVDGEKCGLPNMVIPAVIEVGGKRMKIIPYGHPDSKRMVSEVYGSFVANYSPEANPWKVN